MYVCHLIIGINCSVELISTTMFANWRLLAVGEDKLQWGQPKRLDMLNGKSFFNASYYILEKVSWSW